MDNPAVITGTALLSSKQFENAADWSAAEPQRLTAFPRNLSLGDLYCLGFHPNAADVAAHIPRKSDRRFMEKQFQYGLAASSLAWARTGLRDDDKKETGLFIATRPAERDENIDRRLLTAEGDEALTQTAVNTEIIRNMRPNLFLAQLPNLLASNISIVLGITGTSRTFIGEEIAGVNALHCAVDAIGAGAIARVLVCATLNAERECLLRWLYASGNGTSCPEKSVWDEPLRGVCLGSNAASLMLESEESAQRRGARALARIRKLGRRRVSFAQRKEEKLIEFLQTVRDAVCAAVPTGPVYVLSNTHGLWHSQVETNFWRNQACGRLHVLSTAQLVGSALEADAPTQTALAVRCLSADIPAIPKSAWLNGIAGPAPAPVATVLITSGLEGDVAATLLEKIQ